MITNIGHIVFAVLAAFTMMMMRFAKGWDWMVLIVAAVLVMAAASYQWIAEKENDTQGIMERIYIPAEL